GELSRLARSRSPSRRASGCCRVRCSPGGRVGQSDRGTEVVASTLPPLGGEGRPPSRGRRRTGGGGYGCSVFVAPPPPGPAPPRPPPRHSLRSGGEGRRGVPTRRCPSHCARPRFVLRSAATVAAIAQSVKHIIRNDGVGGSNPSCGTSILSEQVRCGPVI